MALILGFPVLQNLGFQIQDLGIHITWWGVEIHGHYLKKFFPGHC